MLGGIQVYENVNLTQLVPQRIHRTWKERLFSRPWRPRVSWHTVFVQKPDPSLYWIGAGKLMGHPETIKDMFDKARLVLATGELIPLDKK